MKYPKMNEQFRVSIELKLHALEHLEFLRKSLGLDDLDEAFSLLIIASGADELCGSPDFYYTVYDSAEDTEKLYKLAEQRLSKVIADNPDGIPEDIVKKQQYLLDILKQAIEMRKEEDNIEALEKKKEKDNSDLYL